MPRSLADYHPRIRTSLTEDPRELLEDVLPLPMPIRLMGLTLSKLETKGEQAETRPDAQLSLL